MRYKDKSMENSAFLQAVRQQQHDMAEEARTLQQKCIPDQLNVNDYEEFLRCKESSRPWTSLAYSGSICAPNVVSSNPVNSIVFWNMVHVLQELCNLTTAYATPDLPAVRASSLLESLQGHATPTAARENPLVQFFDAVSRIQT